MNQQEQYKIHKPYIEAEGLNKLINFFEYSDYKWGAVNSVNNKIKVPIHPEINDLVHLHKTIRKRKCFTILEFGVGYSTIIMADALCKNEEEWKKLPQKPEMRNRFMFQLFSVDASRYWIRKARKKIPKNLTNRIHLKYSKVKIGTFNNQLCHFYKTLPNIVPDFIYLDGPGLNDVKGEINGLNFQCEERTIMSGDLLLMESTFLPGIFIIVDGRTNNARFLERNFTRNYKIKWDRKGDMTTFELKEERLGKYNLLGSDFF